MSEATTGQPVETPTETPGPSTAPIENDAVRATEASDSTPRPQVNNSSDAAPSTSAEGTTARVPPGPRGPARTGDGAGLGAAEDVVEAAPGPTQGERAPVLAPMYPGVPRQAGGEGAGDGGEPVASVTTGATQGIQAGRHCCTQRPGPRDRRPDCSGTVRGPVAAQDRGHPPRNTGGEPGAGPPQRRRSRRRRSRRRNPVGERPTPGQQRRRARSRPQLGRAGHRAGRDETDAGVEGPTGPAGCRQRPRVRRRRQGLEPARGPRAPGQGRRPVHDLPCTCSRI